MSRRRKIIAAVSGAALVATATGAYLGRQELNEWMLEKQFEAKGFNAAVMEKALMIAGGNPAEAAKESKEAALLAEEFAQARTAPTGVVDAGAYGQAFTAATALPSTAGSWREVTKVPYNADDPRYRDWYSNSSGGAGTVTGRISGLVADGSTLYAASSSGGVFRTSNSGAANGKVGWSPIADQLPALTAGSLAVGPDHALWLGTGDASTGATSYVGSGVYRLANPKTGFFTAADRVGGHELESTTIGRLRVGADGTVWAVTNRGIWFRTAAMPQSAAWKFAYAPNMSYMPGITDDNGNVLVARGANAGGATNAAYKNIVNDIAVDPKNPKHVIAALGWRSGDTYNGFYETSDYTQGGWHRLAVAIGGITNSTDIGYTTFAFSAKGDRLYAMVQQPSKIAGITNLGGIFVSKSGSPLGPWNQIGTSDQLVHSGSALSKSKSDGYSVGVQAWYNQFLTVDPANAEHVWAGLEEVFETKDTGVHWSAVSPYWNFNFPCWSISDAKNTCPMAGHPDQHSVAVGGGYVFFGNDGGVYRRPVNGAVNANGNATDLVSLNDGTMDALQYYSVSVGADTKNGGAVVSGGLQDNGVSNLFKVQPDATNGDSGMGSNFGGDGGDGAADPRNGCHQLQEYVNLDVKMTKDCAVNPGATSEADSTTVLLNPSDPSPRFIAPIALDSGNPDGAIMGGRYVYTSSDIWNATGPGSLTNAFDLGAGHSATGVASHNGTAYAAWCGPCNNAGFARGLATNAGGTWHNIALPADFPNRMVTGFGIDPANPNHAWAAVNGFNRRFTEGPGAGLGHVWETSDGGATWTDATGNLPDVPTNQVKAMKGGLVAATDLGVFYRAAGATAWQNLGTGLPRTIVTDVELGPEGNVYAATYGRGIWSISMP